MSLMLQDIIVTIFSIGAAATLVTRLVTLVRPRNGRSACANCNACAPSTTPKRQSSVRS
jgi:hypothetical protein